MKFIFFLSIFFVPFACGQEWKKFSALNNRVDLELPAKAKNEARGHSIMAAPESNEKETRFVFEDGKKKMVVMFWETFQKKAAHEEMLKHLKASIDQESKKNKVAKLGENVLLATPLEKNVEDDAILYNSGFMTMADDTLIYFGVYFNPEFHKTPKRCTELSSKIVKSFSHGKRRLDLAGGLKTLGFYQDGVEVTLPKDYIYTVQEGPDFMVYDFQKVVKIGERSPTFGLYYGGHPGLHHKRYDENLIQVAKEKMKFLGKEAEWSVVNIGKGKWFMAELISPVPQSEFNLFHAFLNAENKDSLKEVAVIAGTAKFKKNALPVESRQ